MSLGTKVRLGKKNERKITIDQYIRRKELNGKFIHRHKGRPRRQFKLREIYEAQLALEAFAEAMAGALNAHAQRQSYVRQMFGK